MKYLSYLALSGAAVRGSNRRSQPILLLRKLSLPGLSTLVVIRSTLCIEPQTEWLNSGLSMHFQVLHSVLWPVEIHSCLKVGWLICIMLFLYLRWRLVCWLPSQLKRAHFISCSKMEKIWRKCEGFRSRLKHCTRATRKMERGPRHFSWKQETGSADTANFLHWGSREPNP